LARTRLPDNCSHEVPINIGLRTKLCELRLAVLTAPEPYDVIVLVETWLNGDISDAELGLANYSLFRIDRWWSVDCR